MKHLIESHLGMVLILACVAGLALPGLPHLPNESSVAALALLMFLSCYQLGDGGWERLSWRRLGLFYLLRYALLPPLLWLIAAALAPKFATAVFLLSVLPAAVSSPAFTALYGGRVPVAFALVLLSQLMSPLMIPLQFLVIGGPHVTPSPTQLFTTLVIAILLPMALYALVKKHQPSARYFQTQGKFFSILLIAFIIALAIAKQREVILADPPSVVPPLIIALLCYIAYLLAGWAAGGRARKERIAYATGSMFNNAALGVSLALVHFPPEVVLFVAAAEIGWAMLPMVMKGFLRFFTR